MSRLFHMFRRPTSFAVALLCIVGACCGAVWSQQRLSYSPSSALDKADSRAEQEADQLVSLSADKIIALLRQEMGLLLQVKKAIVRKAFEQGRVIDASEITDDGLFTLVREDDSIRVLATREIENRYYIRAQPTRDELVLSIPCRQSSSPNLQSLPPKGQTQSGQSGSQLQLGQQSPSQEQLYWEKHDGDLDCYSLQNAPYDVLQSLSRQLQNTQTPFGQNPFSQYPQQPNLLQTSPQQQYQQQYPQQNPPSQSSPQNQPANPMRQLQMAQLQSPFGNYFENGESDQNNMAQMPLGSASSLLNASQVGGLSAIAQKALGNSTDAKSAVSGMNPQSLGSLGSLNSLGSLLGSQGGGGQSFPQQASLQNPMMQPQLPPYPPTPPMQPMLRHRPNPYADVPSLYDLYAQYSRHSPLPLERFGVDVFRNGTGNFDELPMDLPAGPEYVVGPGDGLSIDISSEFFQLRQNPRIGHQRLTAKSPTMIARHRWQIEAWG